MDPNQPVTANDFTALGVDAATAAALVIQHEQMAGRAGPEARAALNFELRDTMPTPPAPPPAVATSPAQALEALHAHQNAQLSKEFEATFTPPKNAFDYRAPPPLGEPTDEQWAADTALKSMLHAEGTPAYIGNAIMGDLASSRTVEHNLPPEQRTVVLGQLSRMLDLARASPALKPFVADATPEGLLSTLSRETVIALLPWAHYRQR
jgi:hypothetical protein